MTKPRTCAIDSCDAPVQARGWCNRHYLRWWRNGQPDTRLHHWNPQPDTCTIPDCDKPLPPGPFPPNPDIIDHRKVVRAEGLEPSTSGLKGRCSTD